MFFAQIMPPTYL